MPYVLRLVLTSDVSLTLRRF